MRVATNQLYDRPTTAMASLTAQADKLQTQVSTGKRINTPSDDPSAYLRLSSLTRADANDGAWQANIDLAQGLLAQADSALDGVATQIQRAQELALQAANGTYGAAERQSIGAELSAILDQLVSLANSTDVRGQPVFGGAGGETPFAADADGVITYQGSGEAAGIPIGNGSVAPGVPGDRAFGTLFATMQGLVTALSAGEDIPEDAIAGLQSASDSVSAARASIGARGVRLDLEAARIADAKVDREESRQAIEATDISSTITELQKTLTILQATQASFTKLTSLSLFDYLR